MTEIEAVRALNRAFGARIVSVKDMNLPSLYDLNAEMYRDLDNAGHYDEPWWLDMDEH